MPKPSVSGWSDSRLSRSLRLSSGETFQVRHPELAALSRHKLIVVDPDSDRVSA